MEGIQHIDIDGPGNTFKYILLKFTVTKGEFVDQKDTSTLLVRGYSDCAFHGDVLDKARDKIYTKLGKTVRWKLDCMGGGRIKHLPNKLHIYGYSQGYGRADHNATAQLLKAAYEGQNYEVTWSNDGY